MKAKLSSSEFVFRFAEFSRINTTYTLNYTEVDNVSVLRLHFLTPLGTYNLGAVSDIVTGSNIPDMSVTKLDNIQNSLEEISDFFKLIITIVVFIFLFLLLKGPVSFILKLTWDVIKFVFNAVLLLLSLPLRIIAWFFR